MMRLLPHGKQAFFFAALTVLVLAGCSDPLISTAQSDAGTQAAPQQNGFQTQDTDPAATSQRPKASQRPTARLYEGFGNFTRPVSTSSNRAQRYIDQGLQWLYGFNDDEAIRCFQEAARLDPDCAFAWWGIAFANGINVNDPIMSEQESENARAGIAEALARRENASAVERALIEALQHRYASSAEDDQLQQESAYAQAMEMVWQQFPEDPDVGTLYAEALMNLQPWDYWTPTGEGKGRIEEIVRVLESVMAMKPDHPGALHYYIHAVEASSTPERGEAAADRLLTLVPGSSHLTHMPSHIYGRLGRYADAADANQKAVLADRTYLAFAPEQDYYGLYISHNLHFLAYAAMMEGRYETALQAARQIETHVPSTFMDRYPEVADGWAAALPHVLIRFGRWQDILELNDYPETRPISRAMRCYARSIACSALGRTRDARAEIEEFNTMAAAVPIEWTIGFNPAHAVFPLARKMMHGELAFREGDHDTAFRLLREAVEVEDQLLYDEPPSWLQPVRHALGALLMASGRYDEAEKVYEQDLKKNPHNGWALLGLEKARRVQRKTEGLDQLVRARAQAWKRADVLPTSSCYCEPGAISLQKRN